MTRVIDKDLDQSMRCRFCAKNNNRLNKIDNDIVESRKLQLLYEDLTKLEVLIRISHVLASRLILFICFSVLN